MGYDQNFNLNFAQRHLIGLDRTPLDLIPGKASKISNF